MISQVINPLSGNSRDMALCKYKTKSLVYL